MKKVSFEQTSLHYIATRLLNDLLQLGRNEEGIIWTDIITLHCNMSINWFHNWNLNLPLKPQYRGLNFSFSLRGIIHLWHLQLLAINSLKQADLWRLKLAFFAMWFADFLEIELIFFQNQSSIWYFQHFLINFLQLKKIGIFFSFWPALPVKCLPT